MAFWPLFFHAKPIFHKLYYIVVYSLSFSFALFVSNAEITLRQELSGLRENQVCLLLFCHFAI